MNAKLIAPLAMCAALGGAYLLDDPLRAGVDSVVEGFTQWTPERIAGDPRAYLNACEEQTRSALEELEAHAIFLRQRRAHLETERQEAVRKTALGETALSELIALYREVEKGAAWPAVWRAQPLDAGALEAQVLALDREIQLNESLAERCEDGLVLVEQRDLSVSESKAEALVTLAEIGVQLEMLAIEELTALAALAELQLKVQSAAQVASAGPGGPLVDDLLTQARGDVRMAEFNAVLAGED